MLFLVFSFQFCSFAVIKICIEKTRFLVGGAVQKSCQVGGRVGGIVFCSALQNCKEFHQVLDFQRFAVLQYPLQCLCSAFAVVLNSLTFNTFQTSLKPLIFNDFAVLGGSRVGC